MLPAAHQDDEDELEAWNGYQLDDEQDLAEAQSEEEQISEEGCSEGSGNVSTVKEDYVISAEDAKAIEQAQRELEAEAQRDMELEAFMQRLERSNPNPASRQQINSVDGSNNFIDFHTAENKVTQAITSLFTTLQIQHTRKFLCLTGRNPQE